MSQVPAHLVEEARKRGIVPGVMVESRIHGKWTVPPYDTWKMHDTFKGSIACSPVECSTGAWILDIADWATVITPAPTSGLREGDACECGPAMRAAIIELAKELGIHGGWNLEHYAYSPGICLYWSGLAVHSGARTSNHTPEAFIAKMRVTATQPKPITVHGHVVEFIKGHVKIGCHSVDNETVRAIAAKLQD